MADDVTKNYLTAANVATICKVSERTLKNWCSDKHPNPFKRNRRSGRYYWCPEDLAVWLAGQGKAAESDRMETFIRARNKPEKAAKRRDKVEQEVNDFEKAEKRAAREQNRAVNLRELKPVEETAGGDGAKSGGGESAGESKEINLFAVRNATGKVYKKALERLATANAGTVHSEFKNVTSIADTMRRLEMDCLETDRQLRQVIPISLARRFIGEITSRVRSDVMALGHRLCEPLAGMDDKDLIRAFVVRECENVLRHLARDLDETIAMSEGR